MPFNTRVEMLGLQDALDDGFALVERAVTGGVREATDGLKDYLRDRTFRVLGLRVAYSWQGEVYPKSEMSAEAAGYVFTKAPAIISFWSADLVLTPGGGRSFAIPVNPVIKRGGQAMTPREVEAKFGQKLQPRLLRTGNLGLFMDLVAARSRRRPGLREATPRRRAQGREARPVLMFVLVRNLASQKLIDLAEAGDLWGARLPGIIERRLGEGR